MRFLARNQYLNCCNIDDFNKIPPPLGRLRFVYYVFEAAIIARLQLANHYQAFLFFLYIFILKIKMWNDHHQPHPPTTMIPKRSPIRSRSSYRDRLMVSGGWWLEWKCTGVSSNSKSWSRRRGEAAASVSSAAATGAHTLARISGPSYPSAARSACRSPGYCRRARPAASPSRLPPARLYPSCLHAAKLSEACYA